MNTQTATSPPEPWSWADQVSTYRFWGLFAFYLMSVAAAGSLFGFGIFWVIYDTTSSATALGAAGFVMRFAKILGFLLALAWVLAHVQPKRALFVFASLQLIGAALIAVAAVFGDWLYYLAAFFFGAGLGGVLLGVPAVIAGGRGGVETFVLVIGTIAISETFVASMSILTFSVINSPGVLATATGAVILLGLLFLIPVNRVFFSEPPPSRVRSFPPTRRNPSRWVFYRSFPFTTSTTSRVGYIWFTVKPPTFRRHLLYCPQRQQRGELSFHFFLSFR